MTVKYCGDCGKTSLSVKDYRTTRKVGGSTVTTISALCDLCHRDRKHRKFLKHNSA